MYSSRSFNMIFYVATFLVLLFFIKKAFLRQLQNLIEKLSEVILKKSVTYDLMHLHFLFPMVKTTVLYLVSVKIYLKKYS